MGASTNVGGFFGISNGKLSFDAAKRTGSVDVRIATATIDGGTDKFTTNLKRNAFKVEQYPEIRFQSTKFHFDGKGNVSRVDGKLTMMGKTAPVSLTATKFRCYNNPMNKRDTCGGDFETTIDRTQWGLNYAVDMGVSRQVKLTLQVGAEKKD